MVNYYFHLSLKRFSNSFKMLYIPISAEIYIIQNFHIYIFIYLIKSPYEALIKRIVFMRQLNKPFIFLIRICMRVQSHSQPPHGNELLVCVHTTAKRLSSMGIIMK